MSSVGNSTCNISNANFSDANFSVANSSAERLNAAFCAPRFARDSLTALSALYLAGNDFSGVVPSSLAKLTNLRYLGLHDNNFTTEVPPTYIINHKEEAQCFLATLDFTTLKEKFAAKNVEVAELKRKLDEVEAVLGRTASSCSSTNSIASMTSPSVFQE